MTFVIGILGAIAWVVPFWRLFQRLGYTPFLSLLMLVPFVNVGILYYVAFLDWPVERQLPEIEEPQL